MYLYARRTPNARAHAHYMYMRMRRVVQVRNTYVQKKVQA